MHISEYDTESIFFEEALRSAKRQYLESKVLKFVYPAYITMLGHLRSDALQSFQTGLEKSLGRGEGFAASARACQRSSLLEFDQGCSDAAIDQAKWNPSKVREKLLHDIIAHTSDVHNKKLSHLVAEHEQQLNAVLAEPLASLFEDGGKSTWVSIRRLLKRESDTIVSAFSAAITGFELDQETFDKMVQNLREYTRNLIKRKAREEAGRVLIRMKDRFTTVFNHDKDSMRRIWTGKEDIAEITKEARSESLKLLSTMTALRMDEKEDNVENVLFFSLMGGTAPPSLKNRGMGISGDPLAARIWEDVPPQRTLITPAHCKKMWRQFVAETDFTVTQAISAQ